MGHQCVSNGSQNDLLSLPAHFIANVRGCWKCASQRRQGAWPHLEAFGESTLGTQGQPPGLRSQGYWGSETHDTPTTCSFLLLYDAITSNLPIFFK